MLKEKTYHPIPVEEPVSGCVKGIRDRHPAHYLLTINSFSFLLEMLETTEAQSYDSGTFEVSGYKWKLSLYPKGDAERNGEGHISLYLCIQETDDLPRGWEISVDYNFFVFDQLRDKYLVFGDACGKLSRFHELKKECGFARLLSRSLFEDSTQGYLLNDKCVFGVEIFVNTFTTSGEILALPVKLCNAPYIWRLTNYSTLSTFEYFYSDFFSWGNCYWRVSLYPRGNGDDEGKAISLFLELFDPEPTDRIYAEYRIRLKDQKNGKDMEKTAVHVFSNSDDNYGWSFISLKDIEDSSRGFLVQDTLVIQVEITRLASIESFS